MEELTSTVDRKKQEEMAVRLTKVRGGLGHVCVCVCVCRFSGAGWGEGVNIDGSPLPHTDVRGDAQPPAFLSTHARSGPSLLTHASPPTPLSFIIGHLHPPGHVRAARAGMYVCMFLLF